MQAIAQDVVEKNGLKEFEELMREVAELPAELNACEETRIREILERQGVVVPTKERKKKI